MNDLELVDAFLASQNFSKEIESILAPTWQDLMWMSSTSFYLDYLFD